MGKTKRTHKSPYYFPLTVLLGLAMSSCTSSPDVGYSEEPNAVVLVFEDSVVHEFLNQRKAKFKYLDSNNLPIEVRFPNDSIFSGMVIPSQGKWVELNYQDNGEYNYVRLFEVGDSVLVGVENRKLWFNTLNREVLPFDDNFELQRNIKYSNSGYTPLQDFYFLWESSRSSVATVDLKNELFELKNHALESLKLEARWLDSLEKTNQLSSHLASFFLSKNQFEEDKLGFFELEEEVFKARASLQFFTKSQRATSCQFPTIYMDEFADLLIENLSSKEDKELTENLLLEEKSGFSDLILFKFLNRQLSVLSFQEADNLFEIFSNKLDPKLIDILKTKNEKLVHIEQDIKVKSLGNEVLGFEEILEEKKGSILYVDLWAAWCIPCIRSFPESRKIQTNYHDQGIEVVYLSVDKNHKFWDQVVQKYDIAIADRSFIVMNSMESAYIKELNVESIPRYLLYNRDGKLIHKNAPRPESSEIRNLLDSLSSN